MAVTFAVLFQRCVVLVMNTFPLASQLAAGPTSASGFVPLAFNTNFNSFPSGHALTIFCVAVIFTCVWPMLWPLWFAIAAFLAGVRALLTAHFLSDVLIGGGIGLITAREVLLLGFPGFAPGWF